MPEKPRLVHAVRPPADELREHVVALTAGLAARRTEPFVIGDLSRRFREDLTRRGVRWVNRPLPGSLDRAEQKAAAPGLTRLLGDMRPVLIHGHGFEAARTMALAAAGLPEQPPLVTTTHALPPLPGGFFQRMSQRRSYLSALAASGAIITSSDAERGALLNRLGAAPALATRLEVVPPGIEPVRTTSVFDVGEKRYSVGLHRDAAIVATVAPMDELQPVADLLEAADRVSRDVANVEFAIIGSGPRLEELKAMAHDLGLTGMTVFLGARPDATDVIATCNIYAALSDDASGITHALQALSANLRLVALDLPGLRESFDRAESIPVIAAADHDALADAIRTQLEGMAFEEDEIRTADGMAWGVSEVLASQDAYDLDQDGLEPEDRVEGPNADLERLLREHSVDRMISRTLDVYNRLIAEAQSA